MSLDISSLIKQCIPQMSRQSNVALNSLNALQSNNSIFNNLSNQANFDFGGKNTTQLNNSLFDGFFSQLNTNIGGSNVSQTNNSIGLHPTGLDTTTGGTDTITGDDTTTGGTDTITGGDATTTIPDDGKGAWGDPHYHLKGEDGNDIKFDHKGKDNHTYNVFKGDNFQVDGKYVPYAKDPDNPQVIGKARVTAGDDIITFDKKGAATLNDKPLNAGEYDLKDGTHVAYKGKQMILDSPEKDSNIRLKAESSGITVDPAGEFTNPGGIIGKAVTENKELTNEEANKFDVTNQRPIE